MMRVAYLTGPESIEIREVPTPVPGAGEVVVRIEAAATCGTDVKVFRRGGHPRMLKVPTPFGHEMTGVIAAIGAGVEGWSEGDAVIVANSASCGRCAYCKRGQQNLCESIEYLNGAYGEMILLAPRFVEMSLYRRPASLRASYAAVAEPLACVIHGVQVSRELVPESRVLLLGAGPMGLLFVNTLAAAGHHVTVADPNEPRLAMARRMNAAATLLVDRENPHYPSTERPEFDMVIEATGSTVAWQLALESVRPGGSVLLSGGCAPGTTVPLDTHRLHYSEITVRGAYHHRPSTFAMAIEMLASGAVNPEHLLSAELPLDKVGEALHMMMRKEALKVVIRP